jgi:hypothetical protein
MPSGMQGAKKTVMEGGVRNFLAVRGPGVAQGVSSDALLGLVDITPTVVELAGITQVRRARFVAACSCACAATMDSGVHELMVVVFHCRWMASAQGVAWRAALRRIRQVLVNYRMLRTLQLVLAVLLAGAEAPAVGWPRPWVQHCLLLPNWNIYVNYRMLVTHQPAVAACRCRSTCCGMAAAVGAALLAAPKLEHLCELPHAGYT